MIPPEVMAETFGCVTRDPDSSPTSRERVRRRVAARRLPELLDGWHIRLASEASWLSHAVHVDGLVSIAFDNRTLTLDGRQRVNVELAPRIKRKVSR